MSARAPFFPGNVAVTDLRVYTDVAADGAHGGSPHVHLVSSEAYFVTAGAGRLTTLSPPRADGGGLQHTELRPGMVLWFTPGVIHRLVNDDDLRIIVIMSDRGLPEAGDAVMTFPSEVLADPSAYARAARLPDPAEAEETRAAAAALRRDLAVEGFGELVRSFTADADALNRFYRQAVAIVSHRSARWLELFEESSAQLARQTREAIITTQAGQIHHLLEATLTTAQPLVGDRAFGMCGRLRSYDVKTSGGAG